jgi:hypothetical protein
VQPGIHEITGRENVLVRVRRARTNHRHRRNRTRDSGWVCRATSAPSGKSHTDVLTPRSRRANSVFWQSRTDRNLKRLRCTGIMLWVLAVPNVNLKLLASNFGTSVQMLDHFYLKLPNVQMRRDELVG